MGHLDLLRREVYKASTKGLHLLVDLLLGLLGLFLLSLVLRLLLRLNLWLFHAVEIFSVEISGLRIVHSRLHRAKRSCCLSWIDSYFLY